jgi:hypothetical protein
LYSEKRWTSLAFHLALKISKLSKLEAIITKIGVEKIFAVVSDNGSNVAAAHAISEC